MLGVAILGSGAIAAVHADSFLSFPDLSEIRAVCDLFPEKAQALIDEKGLKNAKAYKDIKDVLPRTDLDLVSICLPPQTHAEVAVLALDAGKHVLCEKPMAASLEECDAMLAAAMRNQRILSPVTNNRFKTPNQKVKAILASGAAGPVRHAIFNSLWWRGPNYYDIWWRGKWETEGGGCMTSHAVHHLDLLLWMLGKPDRVTAVMTNTAHGNSECEDLGIAILEYFDKRDSNGKRPAMLVQAASSLVTHDEEQEIVIQAEKGRLSVPWRTASSQALPNGFPEPNPAAAAALQKHYDALPVLDKEGHVAQIGNVLRAIKGDEKLAVTGEEGRNAIELITAIYKAAAAHQPVTLPLSKDDPFYSRAGLTAAMPHFFEKHKSVENFATSKITLGRDLGK